MLTASLSLMHVHLLCEPNENASSCVNVCMFHVNVRALLAICFHFIKRCSVDLLAVVVAAVPLMSQCVILFVVFISALFTCVCVCSESVDNVRLARAYVYEINIKLPSFRPSHWLNNLQYYSTYLPSLKVHTKKRVSHNSFIRKLFGVQFCAFWRIVILQAQTYRHIFCGAAAVNIKQLMQ